MNKLTASEVTNLMGSYLTNTMASVITADLLRKTENPELKSMLQFGLEIANGEVKGAMDFLQSDNRGLPQAFTVKDILLPDIKYYSDNFVILIKYKLGQDALNFYALCLSTAINPKVRAWYINLINKTVELIDQCIALMIKHGLHQPLIYLPRTDEIKKINEKDFLGTVIDKKRALSGQEVLHLTHNYMSTEVFREVLRTFKNTKTPELSEHFDRGKNICSKQLESIQGKLEKEELPQLPTWESEVDAELPAPFSDRLLLFKSSLIAGATVGRYGVSASSVLRKDVGAMFLKLMAETLLFAEDTGNLLVKYKLIDQPPLIRN